MLEAIPLCRLLCGEWRYEQSKQKKDNKANKVKEKELKSKEMVVEIEQKTRRYREIISFREMQDRINNREINY